MRALSKHILLLIIVSLYFCSCATTGPGGKKSLIIIPTSQEVAIGSGMAEEVSKTEVTLPDSVWQNYLNEVGQRIVRVSDRKDIEYHFTVIESDQINAFAAPGGFVYFYTGLLREMNSEAEMAAVMAHEISHVVARHGIKRVQSAMGVQLAYALVFGGDDAGAAVNAGIGLGMGLLFADYSRGAEREADQYGIHYMIKAGYDPAGAVDMFETLGRLGGERSGNVFEKLVSSHPETQERIANAKSQISKQQPLPKHLSLGKEKYQLMLKRLPPKPDGN
ncbi:MAG: M48 family metalloprotease [candidate division Zixibacteria bacterium]|nr:M48 family metalloprotease [candidate division Zixibacteria bacterium]